MLNMLEEKILTFEDLLILCKNNEVIIDLNLVQLDYNNIFKKLMNI